MDINKMLKGKIPGSKTEIDVKKSICTICDPMTQCGMDLYVKNGKIIKVEGSKENPYNRGALCSKGAATRQYVYNEDRLKTPLKRKGPRGSGSYEPITWDDAMNIIVDKLNNYKQKYGPESVVFFSGYAKWFRPFLQRLAYAFGSPNYLTESSVCFQAMAMAQQLVFGLPGAPDVKNTRCVMVWSANPFYTNCGNAGHLVDAKNQGVKIIVVDPRITPTTNIADIHLQLKPGTDGALALAMANVIINEELYDADFVHGYTYGFDEYRNYVKQFTPEKAEEITGVPAYKIRKAARMYATTKPASIMPSASPVVHHTNGVNNYRAVFSLVGLTGNYDIYGGNYVNPPSYLYVSGGFKTRADDFVDIDKENMAPRIGSSRFPVWDEMVDEGHSMELPNQIQSGTPYPIKALLGFGLNYRMWPDSKFMAESLAKLDFFVNLDIFMTDSCKLADIILPVCTSVERSELRCYAQNYVIYTQPVIEPLYESRTDIDVIFDLAKRLELDDELLKTDYETCLDWILEPSGITIDELKKHPGGMKVPNPVDWGEKKYLKIGFKTPSGKLEFKSKVLEKYDDTSKYPTLPAYMPPKYSKEATPEMAEEYPFILNTGSRLPMFVHTRTFRLPWTKSLRPEAAADINPQDAEKLDISQGDEIRLKTPKDAITVKANLTKTVLPGVIHMYHGYKDADVNQLIEADYLDPISGYPGYKSLLCKIEKV